MLNQIFFFNKRFSTVTVSRFGKNIMNFQTQDAKVNWQLARLFITPQNNVHSNKVSSGSGSENEQAVNKTSKDVGIVKFNNYLRKMGKIISHSSDVYVQSGVYEGKNVRVVSAEKESVSALSSLLSSQESSQEGNVDIVVLTKGELAVKKFILSDKDSGIIITNSLNTDMIKETVNKL